MVATNQTVPPDIVSVKGSDDDAGDQGRVAACGHEMSEDADVSVGVGEEVRLAEGQAGGSGFTEPAETDTLRLRRLLDLDSLVGHRASLRGWRLCWRRMRRVRVLRLHHG